jgi:ElaB/YqjD/DUF883 family membrane-anchored ribosome-binding protein
MDNVAGGIASSFSAGTNGSEGPLNRASAGAHAAVDSVAGAADDLARKAKPAIERVATLAHAAVDKAAGVAAPTADWLREMGESMNATQKKLLTNTCSYVAANPLKSLGMAVAAGYLISRMTR